MDWVLYLVIAVVVAAAAAGGLALFFRFRKRWDASGTAAPSSGPAPGDSDGGDGTSPSAQVPARKHIPPKIVSASGPPIPRPRLLDPGAMPDLSGVPPKVAREASEEEVEECELEDMAREAIDSTKMMVNDLMTAGKDVSAALRQLAAAEEYLEKGQPSEALKYAGKAMDVAESLEAEQDRCPRCKAETKPRWRLCPKCGQPLRTVAMPPAGEPVDR